MAKLGETQSFGQKMAAARAAKKANIPESTPAVETKNLDMNAILARLERQEAELKELKKGKEVSFKDSKEHYKGPRNYAFSLWGGVPVLSWESFKKDPTLDFEYKNQFGVWQTNHYMRLYLADGEQVEVSNFNFNRDRQKTDPMPAKVMTNELGESHYTFDTELYGKVEILSSKFLN